MAEQNNLEDINKNSDVSSNKHLFVFDYTCSTNC